MKLLFIAVISSIALAGCNIAHQQTGAIGGRLSCRRVCCVK